MQGAYIAVATPMRDTSGTTANSGHGKAPTEQNAQSYKARMGRRRDSGFFIAGWRQTWTGMMSHGSRCMQYANVIKRRSPC